MRRKLKVSLVFLGLLLLTLWVVSLVVSMCATLCTEDVSNKSALLWNIPWYPIWLVMIVGIPLSILWALVIFFWWLWTTASSIVDRRMK